MIEEIRVCNGTFEHRHNDHEYWHPTQRQHSTDKLVEQREQIVRIKRLLDQIHLETLALNQIEE